jgi:uncharacterized protein YxjI
MATTAMRPSVFAGRTFRIRQKIFTLGSKQFFIEDASGAVVGFCKQKFFKLKDDVRLYTDESMTAELMTVKARSVLDFSVAFDVVDSSTGEKVGALKRKGWKSILKDEWILMDAMDQEIGRIKEDSILLATLRRFVTNLIPQKYVFVFDTHEIGSAKQNFNMLAPKLDLDFSADLTDRLDRRLGVAAGMLLIAIEGRQR